MLQIGTSVTMPPSWCWFGLLLGMRHALEPDHLAAVSTLVVEHQHTRSGIVLGGMWGIGHTLALLVVATLLALAGAAMPARLATAFELGVAVMLIGIGLRSMTRAPRAHGAVTRSGRSGRSGDDRRWPGARRSLLVGTLHGLAGGGALTALVASQLPSTFDRLLTVALFGLGSIVGMVTLSGVAGWPLARLGRSPVAARVLMIGTGLLALGLGVGWGLPLLVALLA